MCLCVCSCMRICELECVDSGNMFYCVMAICVYILCGSVCVYVCVCFSVPMLLCIHVLAWACILMCACVHTHVQYIACMCLCIHNNSSNNNSNNERISRTLFHVKHAQLR